MSRITSAFSLQSDEQIHERDVCTSCNVSVQAFVFPCAHKACEKCAHSLAKCHECDRLVSGRIKKIDAELKSVLHLANSISQLETGNAGQIAQASVEEEEVQTEAERTTASEVQDHLPTLPTPKQTNLFQKHTNSAPICVTCRVAPQAVELGCGHCVCFSCSTQLGMCSVCNKMIWNRTMMVDKYHSSFDYHVKMGQPLLMRDNAISTYAQRVQNAADAEVSSVGSVVTPTPEVSKLNQAQPLPQPHHTDQPKHMLHNKPTGHTDLVTLDSISDDGSISDCSDFGLFQGKYVEEAPQCVSCKNNPQAIELGCGHCLCSACSLKLGVCNVCKKVITSRLKMSFKYRSSFDYIVREQPKIIASKQQHSAAPSSPGHSRSLQLCTNCKRSPQQAIMHCRGGCSVGVCTECTDILRNRHVKFRICIACDNRVIKITEPHGAQLRSGPECNKCFVRNAKHTYFCARGCRYRLCNRCGNVPKSCCGFPIKRKSKQGKDKPISNIAQSCATTPPRSTTPSDRSNTTTAAAARKHTTRTHAHATTSNTSDCDRNTNRSPSLCSLTVSSTSPDRYSITPSKKSTPPQTPLSSSLSKKTRVQPPQPHLFTDSTLAAHTAHNAHTTSRPVMNGVCQSREENQDGYKDGKTDKHEDGDEDGDVCEVASDSLKEEIDQHTTSATPTTTKHVPANNTNNNTTTTNTNNNNSSSINNNNAGTVDDDAMSGLNTSLSSECETTMTTMMSHLPDLQHHDHDHNHKTHSGATHDHDNIGYSDTQWDVLAHILPSFGQQQQQ